MAFSLPKNLPDFGAPHRNMEDRAWAAISRRGGTTSSSVLRGKIFGDDDELPMYKDKPYRYAPSDRRRRWWRRKRVIAALLAVLLFLYYGGFLPGTGTQQKSASAWSLLHLTKSREPPNWDERRKSVVEAFELSWDSYERYGWGKGTKSSGIDMRACLLTSFGNRL